MWVNIQVNSSVPLKSQPLNNQPGVYTKKKKKKIEVKLRKIEIDCTIQIYIKSKKTFDRGWWDSDVI